MARMLTGCSKKELLWKGQKDLERQSCHNLLIEGTKDWEGFTIARFRMARSTSKPEKAELISGLASRFTCQNGNILQLSKLT